MTTDTPSILDRTATVNYSDATGAVTDLFLAQGLLTELAELAEHGEVPPAHLVEQARTVAKLCRDSHAALVPQVRG